MPVVLTNKLRCQECIGVVVERYDCKFAVSQQNCNCYKIVLGKNDNHSSSSSSSGTNSSSSSSSSDTADYPECECCKICKRTTSRLLDEEGLKKLAAVGIKSEGGDQCSQCQKPVYHFYASFTKTGSSLFNSNTSTSYYTYLDTSITNLHAVVSVNSACPASAQASIIQSFSKVIESEKSKLGRKLTSEEEKKLLDNFVDALEFRNLSITEKFAEHVCDGGVYELKN
jgi:hypothetical protein